MAAGLSDLIGSGVDRGATTLHLGDSADSYLSKCSVDFVLTSPPYCTRIDYTSVTRIELAVLNPLMDTSFIDLGRKMVGSTRVPLEDIAPIDAWGPTCLKLIEAIGKHPSKASGGYYKKTHLDYFYKLERSVESISTSLKDRAAAVFVVQDSYYKEVHNDLPKILTEIAGIHNLVIRRREDFKLTATLASSHPHSRKYDRPKGATEAVLCFEKA